MSEPSPSDPAAPTPVTTPVINRMGRVNNETLAAVPAPDNNDLLAIASVVLIKVGDLLGTFMMDTVKFTFKLLVGPWLVRLVSSSPR